jgi:hypothetical protein
MTQMAWLAALALPPISACADGPPVVTILEGRATVFRGSWKFDAVLGVPMQPDDLVQTGGDSFVRIEYDDGALVDLGPATRVQVNHPAAARFDRPALYVLSGWLKLQTGVGRKLSPARIATPAFDASGIAGSVLARVGAGGDAFFVELGEARIVPRPAPGLPPSKQAPIRPSPMKTGEYVSVGADRSLGFEVRPAADFVAGMPRTFLVSIPPQLPRFRGHEVEEPPAQAFTYGEVEAWIDAEPAIRRQFVQAWRSKLVEPSFRHEMASNLGRHPEWDRALFPERYARKRPPDAPPRR